MENTDAFIIYDELLYKPMADAGWRVDTIPWTRTGVDWGSYEAVIIRSPWDYQDDPQRFLRLLDEIDQSPARLINDSATVHWNIDKRYLQEVERGGSIIVPTIWGEGDFLANINEYFDKLDCEELVIKPTVSANADNTYRLNRDAFVQQQDELAQIFSQRSFMIQPFMQNIIEEGEFSLFYFAGQYSHAILKTPQSGDFRVQEEHGGQIAAYTAPDSMQKIANKVLEQLEVLPFFARIDLVRFKDSFAIMELELIEPSLYFNYDAESPRRFTQAFVQLMDKP